jgi:glutathione S-transferase
MLTFFQEPFSHWCVKTKKILDYKKIKYKTRNVGYHDKRELIKATGQDYVPALVNDGKVITYPDVPDYLESLAPHPTIYPDRTRALAKAIENWAHYRLEDVCWKYIVTAIPKTFKDDLERWVFVEIQELKRGPLELMETRRPTFRKEMEAHLEIVEGMLEDHKFLLCEKPSLADFAVFGAINPVRYAGENFPKRFKKLHAWNRSIDRI